MFLYKPMVPITAPAMVRAWSGVSSSGGIGAVKFTGVEEVGGGGTGYVSNCGQGCGCDLPVNVVART